MPKKKITWKDIGQLAQLPAKIHVGKRGITDTLKEEVRQRVKKEGAVKIRILKNSPVFKQRKDVFKQLAPEVGAKVIRMMGHTAIFVHESLTLPNEE